MKIQHAPLLEFPLRVLFLDIDGVLNSEMYARAVEWFKSNKRPVGKLLMPTGIWDFCPYASAIFADMMKRLPDVKIVISSTWRLGRTVEDLQELFNQRDLDGSRIIDKTKNLVGAKRGLEIQAWLTEHPEVKEFVILDDDSDMLHLIPYLVKTRNRNGLTCDKADEVVARFEGKSRGPDALQFVADYANCSMAQVETVVEALQFLGWQKTPPLVVRPFDRNAA